MTLLSWGKLRRKPATRLLDESFAPIGNSEERFARQHPDGPPPEFPLASPWSPIVRNLSGPNINIRMPFYKDLCIVFIFGFLLPTFFISFHRFYFHSAWEIFLNFHTYIYVRLLGPCFKTGFLELFFKKIFTIFLIFNKPISLFYPQRFFV